MSETVPPQKLVLVTGPSGAGRSTAINALEDVGFEAIDNLPLSLVPRLLAGGTGSTPLVLGIDVRNRDFSTQAFLDLLDQLALDPRVDLQLLYLDCDADVLLRRYSETRRRHPMAPAESPDQGVARELDLLAPIRRRADILTDTTDLGPHELRAEMSRWFAPDSGGKLAISIHSFSYKRGLPRGIDMILDVRFLRNPYWHPPLRGLDGRAAEVAAFIEEDPRFDPFFVRVRDLVELLLPAYIAEGKAHFAIGFGCTGGQHRSVAIAERLAQALAESGWQVSIRHREMEWRAAANASPAHEKVEKA